VGIENEELNMFHQIPAGLLKEKSKANPHLEPWEVEQARAILQATGKISDFRVEDMDKDNLREIVGNMRRGWHTNGEELSNC